MASRIQRVKRDIEKDYPAGQFVAKLRRLADCIEHGVELNVVADHV